MQPCGWKLRRVRHVASSATYGDVPWHSPERTSTDRSEALCSHRDDEPENRMATKTPHPAWPDWPPKILRSEAPKAVA